MASVRSPIVRHFLACEEIEAAADGPRISLANLIGYLQLTPGAEFPHIVPQICLYAQLTDTQGAWPISVQLWKPHVTDEDSLLFPSKTRIIDFGWDPLAVHGLPIRLRNIVFPTEGLYEFRLLCGDVIIAREPIVLRGAS